MPPDDALNRADTALGILQKLAIVLGIGISAWFFIWNEEGKTRVKVDLTAEPLKNCWAALNIELVNTGRNVVTITSQTATLTGLTTEGTTVKRNLITLEPIDSERILRSGEQSNWVSIISGKRGQEAPENTSMSGLHDIFVASFAYEIDKEHGDAPSTRRAETLVTLQGC